MSPDSENADLAIVRLGARSETSVVYTILGGPPEAPEGERDLDLHQAPLLLDALSAELAHGQSRTVILDLTPLLFADSAGLQAMVYIRQRLDANGRRLYVTGLGKSVLKVFQLMHLNRYIPVFQSVEEATAAAAASTAKGSPR